MSTTVIVIFVILIILFFCGAFDKIIYPNDFKKEAGENKNNKFNISHTYEKKTVNKIEFNKIYVCQIKHDVATCLIFFENGYVGIVDAVETPFHSHIKSEIIRHFENYLNNPKENLNHEFGKYIVSNHNQINLYFAQKHDYFDGIDNLPYMYTGFEGAIESNYLLLNLTKKWYNQSLKKSEISILGKNLLFKTF